MKRFLQRLLGSKSKQAKATPRKRRPLSPSFEVLEDRRLMALGALSNALPTGVGTWLDGVVRVHKPGRVDISGSGALLAGGRHVLTAAHVLKAEDGSTPAEVRVAFDLPGGPVNITVPRANFRIHQDFSGWGSFQNDIAILVLPTLAPADAPRYDIYCHGDEPGQEFVLAGYGQAGTGYTGNQPGTTGTRRYTHNRFDDVNGTRLRYDFDNPEFDATAVGYHEGNGAPGDSGGPLFLGNRIAGVSSSGNAGENNFRFGTASLPTRVSLYVHWIDRITGNHNPDVVLNMNQTFAGNNGSPDTIEARVNGERTELVVNGAIVLGVETCRMETLTIIGSNDDDTIKVDGRLGIPLMPIDGRGGWDKLEINDRAGANYLYYVSTAQAGNENWSVGMSGIEDLALYTGYKDSEVEIRGLPAGRTTIYGGNNAEKFYVGGQWGSLDDLAGSDGFKLYGELEIVGGAGADTLIIQEGVSSYFRSTGSTFTITDSNVFRSRTQPNYDGWQSRHFKVSTDYSGIETLMVWGSKVGNQFVVKSTSAGTAVTLEGSDQADTFAVGSSQNPLDSIRGLQMNGKSGHDVLTLVDTASRAIKPIAQDEPTYVLDSSYVRRSQWVRLSLNKPGAQIESTYNYTGIEALSLWGSHLGGLYSMQSVAASTDVKVQAGSGDDRFLFNYLHQVENITIDGGAGVDRAYLSDSGNPARESGPINYALGPTYVQLTGQGGLTTTVNFLLSGPGTPGHLEGLDLFTSDGDDMVDVYGTWPGLPVALHMGQGNDRATLHNWGPWVLSSDLSIDGEADYDRVIVKDGSSNAPQTYEITANTIGRAGEIPLRHDTVESLELNAGNFDDVFNVQGTLPGATTINSGDGNDSFHLQDYAGTLDSLQGWLHLEGQAGDFNSLYLNDGLNPVGQTYSIDAGGIHRSGVASITYANLQIISLTAGLGNDVVAFGHAASGLPIYLDGNAGRDTLDYSHYDVDVFVDLGSWVATDTAWASNFENVLGGNGNDQLFGDDFDNVLLGGPGIDLLEGRGGRDLLIGGLDADTLFGGSDDDLLIGGSTLHDADLAALLAIMDEWSLRELNYQERIDHLRGVTEGGLNGLALLAAETVMDEIAGDWMEGSEGLDWFFGDLGGIADLLPEELAG
jgi:hypothetical protein